MTRAEGGEPETVQTLDRGLRVLELLAEAPPGRTINELAIELGVSRAVIYRLVATLERHRVVRRADDAHVRLGFGLLELARDVVPHLRSMAQAPLRTLAEFAGATAHLTVVDAGEALAVAVVEPRSTDMHVAYRTGARHALGLGAAGQAILLGQRRERPDAAAARIKPWVSTTGELQPGATGVAAPILGVEGLQASVGVVALGDLDVARIGPRVAAAADEIAVALR
ncbi:MAG: IclR family transcriptional regulator [Pseudonocardiales bacterium]|nr:MAG: IclR family transcriptional regulator [Pseudonocardiales bacterium]